MMLMAKSASNPSTGPKRIREQAGVERDLNALAQTLQSALTSGDWERALQTADRMLEAVPRHAPLHYNRALVLKRLGRDAEAIDGLRTALDCDPNHDNARFELASTCLETGKAQEAADLLEIYLADHPDDADARINLGNARLALGEPAVGLVVLKAAHKQAPSDLSARSLSIAERDCGNMEACRSLLETREKTPANAADNLKIMTQGSKGKITLSVKSVKSN